MNQLMCPHRGTLQKVTHQFAKGTATKGSLIILNCCHAFELVPLLKVKP